MTCAMYSILVIFVSLLLMYTLSGINLRTGTVALKAPCHASVRFGSMMPLQKWLSESGDRLSNPVASVGKRYDIVTFLSDDRKGASPKRTKQKVYT